MVIMSTAEAEVTLPHFNGGPWNFVCW